MGPPDFAALANAFGIRAIGLIPAISDSDHSLGPRSVESVLIVSAWSRNDSVLHPEGPAGVAYMK